MIPELSQDPYVTTKQTECHIRKTLEYFEKKGLGLFVLDVGRRSPLTEALENRFKMRIDNTSGDLDSDFIVPYNIKYKAIIYSHTIEHQFNPLNTLLKLKEFMSEDTRMYIITPDRGKLLWCKGHFHEIDSYRIGLLLKRAGLELVSKTRQKAWRNWKEYLKGLRPLYRLIREYNTVYECQLKK